MSRRKQSDASEISRKRLRCDDKEGEINDPGDKWSEEEKNRLLEALEKDGGKNNWRSIARQVRTKDTVQVKLFASQLRAEKQAASDQGALAPKDNSSLDEWITVTEKLKGDDDVDGTCIPQKGTEVKDGGNQESHLKKEVQLVNTDQSSTDLVRDGQMEDQQIGPSVTSSSDLICTLQSIKDSQIHLLQEFGARMDTLLGTQKELKASVAQLEAKLEKLHKDVLSNSTHTDILHTLVDKVDQLNRNTMQKCPGGGGAVIIHTPSHASIIHKPAMDCCGSTCCLCAGALSKSDCSSICGAQSDRVPRQRPAEVEHVTAVSSPANNHCSCVVHRSVGTVESITTPENPELRPAKDQTSTRCSVHRMVTHLPSTVPVCQGHGSSQNAVSDASKSLHTVMCNVSSSLSSPPNVNNSVEEISQGLNSPNHVATSVGDGCPSIAVSKPNPVFVTAAFLDNSITGNVVPFGQQTSVTSTHPPSSTATYRSTQSTSTASRRVIIPVLNISQVLRTTESCTSLTNSASKTSVSCSCINQHTSCSVRSPKPSLPQIEAVVSSKSVLAQATLSAKANVQNVPLLVCQSLASQPKEVCAPPGLVTSHYTVANPHLNRPTYVVTSVSNLGAVTGTTQKQTVPFVTTSVREGHSLPLLLSKACSTTALAASTCTVAVSARPTVSPSPSSAGLPEVRTNSPRTSRIPNLPTMVALPSSNITVVRTGHSDTSVGPMNHKQNGQIALNKDSASSEKRPDESSLSSNTMKESSYSQQEVLKAAVVISKFVSEQPNEEHQATWRSCLTGIASQYKNVAKDQFSAGAPVFPSVGNLPQTVCIGDNPELVLTKNELEDILERSKGRANSFALRLAEQLYGEEVLMKSTPSGIGGKAALKPSTLEAIKVEVIRRFAADKNDVECKELWKQCFTSISQRCKRARGKKSATGQTSGEESTKHVAKVAVVERYGEELCGITAADRHESADIVPNSSTGLPHLPNTSSDHDKEPVKAETPMDISAVCDPPMRPNEPTGEIPSNISHEIPPGIDPDITVVHIPIGTHPDTMKVTRNQANHDQLSSGEGQNMSTERSVTALQLEQTEEGKESDHCEDGGGEKEKFYGECLQVLGSIYNPSAPAASTVTVSGIKMTRDFSKVIIGGNPTVTVPRQKYLDSLERSSQPTHFAVRLAELTYGDDVLKVSTVTGAKPGTKHLDATVLDAIQAELIERFMKHESREVQSIIWRKCLTSIATRCKMLRYHKARNTSTSQIQHPTTE